MKLVIDVGNSRLKWGVWGEQGLDFKGAFSNRTIDFDKVFQSCESNFDSIAISNVSSIESLTSLKDYLKDRFRCPITVPRSTRELGGIVNAYPCASDLGIDRLLGMIAAHHRFPERLCVVGCGSALTLDYVEPDGRHLGGLIAPGFRLMVDSLIEKTANIDVADQQLNEPLTNSTNAAVWNGAQQALIGLVTYNLTLMENKHGEKARIIVTGGAANVIMPYLTGRVDNQPYLVLHGLALLAE